MQQVTTSTPQGVPSVMNVSPGQSGLCPVHVSAMSQSPFFARHSVPTLPATCWHAFVVPSHVSVVHTFPSSVHAVPADCLPSGHVVDVPVQVSSTSHSPFLARHTVVPGLNPS